MMPMTSPDDPVFFLHHCFVDKIWADWQAQQLTDNPTVAPHYAPLAQGPPGHNIDDQLKPWRRTIRDVLDIAALGYAYDQPATLPELLSMASAIRVGASGRDPIPVNLRRSPFAAE